MYACIRESSFVQYTLVDIMSDLLMLPHALACQKIATAYLVVSEHNQPHFPIASVQCAIATQASFHLAVRSLRCYMYLSSPISHARSLTPYHPACRIPHVSSNPITCPISNSICLFRIVTTSPSMSNTALLHLHLSRHQWSHCIIRTCLSTASP